MQVKRETGENPVQGRCCVGVAVAWKSLGEVPEKRSSCVGCQSQKTCLYITHVNSSPGPGVCRAAAVWQQLVGASHQAIRFYVCSQDGDHGITSLLCLFSIGVHMDRSLPVQFMCVL